MSKLDMPYFKFFPHDWQADESLRFLSPPARAGWLEMLLLMHQAPVRGHLLNQAHEPIPASHIARLINHPEADAEAIIAELRKHRVFDERDGVIISRRMVRDTERYLIGVDNGKKGGNPALKPGVNPRLKPGVRPQKLRSSEAQCSEARQPTSQHTPPTPSEGERPGCVRRGGGAAGGRKRSKGADPPYFAVFWDRYPRKVKRPAAVEAFAAIAPDTDLVAKMLAAINSQLLSEQWAADEGRYIPYPVNWLNNRQWEGVPALTEDMPAEVADQFVAAWNATELTPCKLTTALYAKIRKRWQIDPEFRAKWPKAIDSMKYGGKTPNVENFLENDQSVLLALHGGYSKS